MDAIAAWLMNNGSGVGFAGLVTLTIWLILTGRLVPKSSIDAWRADWNARLDGKDGQIQDWRQANSQLLDAVAIKDKQLDELIEAFRALAAQSKEAP